MKKSLKSSTEYEGTRVMTLSQRRQQPNWPPRILSCLVITLPTTRWCSEWLQHSALPERDMNANVSDKWLQPANQMWSITQMEMITWDILLFRILYIFIQLINLTDISKQNLTSKYIRKWCMIHGPTNTSASVRINIVIYSQSLSLNDSRAPSLHLIQLPSHRLGRVVRGRC